MSQINSLSLSLSLSSSIPTLKSLCQSKLLEILEKNNFHPRLINDLFKLVRDHLLLEPVLERLLVKNVITDVALIAFLVPSRMQLHMLGCVQIRNSTLKQIGYNCPNLRSLNLSDCVQVSNSVIRTVLQGCHMLEHLKVDRCHRVTDSAFDLHQSPFETLVSCLSLKAISLQGCPQVTGDIIHTLNTFFLKVQSLNFSQCKNIESLSLANIFEHKQLKTLNLSFIENISDESFSVLPINSNTNHNNSSSYSLTNNNIISQIQKLNISKSIITDIGLSRIASLSNLTELRLQWCINITDTGINIVTSKCLQLRVIDLKSCLITDDSLKSIAINSKNLHTLDISWCSSITDTGIEYLSIFGIEDTDSSEINAYNDSNYDPSLVNNIENIEIDIDIDDIIHSTNNNNQVESMLLKHEEELSLKNNNRSKLQKISLIWCPLITESSLVSLSLLSKIKTIECSGCGTISNIILDSLNLRGINVVL